ncbi:Sds3-like-domain-containing protein [Podospora australis]|uniref:Sds3-like-domain-containing protein n=1 Tax=Podospora australis TaxID=1536484 RepID=A0AAN7APD2_9PEZI|nr:Sds3-like-domain-containing protein [Podospora australis]
MATGDTALPLALSSPPQHLLDNTSNLSSPLSEVEDKYDDDHEEADLDMIDENSHTHSTPKRNGAHGGPDSDLASEPEEDSKLSEVDVNDSEAETERLYDTPPKNGATRDIVNPVDGTGIRRFTDRRERAFERSPSKLQQQLKADMDAEAVANGNNDGSEEEEEEAEDDDVSMASADRESEPPVKALQQRSPTQEKKSQLADSNESAISQGSSDDSTESRKRKRSSVAESAETERPPKKRTGSIDPADREHSADGTPAIDDEKLSTVPESGNHTAEEDNIDEQETISETKAETVESVEQDVVIPRPKRGKRSPVKRRQSKSPEGATPQEAPDEPPEDGDVPSAVPTPQAEDHGDTEAALRNEEELERKRAAWDELTAIEKQFSNFRERLYQERLEQINREEEMLQGPNPTHPEYLAMLQCLEERRQEKIRLSEIELKFKMSVLNHRAVADRSQVMSQFYQSVRASREKTLEALGRDWHDVQQQRRRRSNLVPEFGLPFPPTKQLAVRQAVSYTREVSILSGFAKHVGFPAAPAIHGATEEQLDDDLEAISNAREPVPRPVPNPLPQFPQDLSTGFGLALGPAGEQFIEQTPWANPRHPAHQQQRHNTWEQLTSAASSSAPRRFSQQPGGLFSSSTSTIPAGDSPVQVHKLFPPVHHDATKRSKIVPEQTRREPAVHAS